MIIGAIDIGSNAVRLAIASGKYSHQFEIIKKMRIPLRLGTEAFGPEQTFSKETIHLSSNIFKSFREIMKEENVEAYKAYATSAFRDATNSIELSDAIYNSSKIKIEKISGDFEAKLILNSLIDSPILKEKKNDYLLFDLGGGSLELSKIEHGKISGSKSFDLGTVRLLNFINSHKKDPKATTMLLDSYREEIQSFFDTKFKKSEGLNVIGTGGNFRRILKLRNSMFKNPKDYFTLKKLSLIYEELSNLSYKEIIETYKLKPDRADVIIPAMLIIKTILETLPVKKVYAPDIGLINGILMSQFK